MSKFILQHRYSNVCVLSVSTRRFWLLFLSIPGKRFSKTEEKLSLVLHLRGTHIPHYGPSPQEILSTSLGGIRNIHRSNRSRTTNTWCRLAGNYGGFEEEKQLGFQNLTTVMRVLRGCSSSSRMRGLQRFMCFMCGGNFARSGMYILANHIRASMDVAPRFAVDRNAQ